MYSDNGFGRGNGYDFDAGMSNNALRAYARGVKPISKISIEDLKTAGWRGTKSLALFLAKKHNGADTLWHPSEWHHSGGDWFNKVDFYDPSILVEEWSELAPAEQIAWGAQHRASKNTPKPTGQRVKGYYTIWGGTRRRPRRVGEQPFAGTLIGDWIHVDAGGRKKASSIHLHYTAE